jgi:DNA-binding FrmR family transcriptional regulator
MMQHASHKSRLPDLQRIKARLRDVARMIETERCCVDIIR